MKNRYSRLAMSIALAGTLSLSLIACGKHDEIEVPVVEDSVLTANVKAALAADPELKGLVFEVAAKAGIVTLGGAFESYPAIDRALNVAKGVTGVRSIDDKTTKKDGPAVAAPAAAEAPAEAPTAAPAEAPAK